MTDQEYRTSPRAETVQVRYAGARYATVHIRDNNLTVTGVGPYDRCGSIVDGGLDVQAARAAWNLQAVLEVFGVSPSQAAVSSHSEHELVRQQTGHRANPDESIRATPVNSPLVSRGQRACEGVEVSVCAEVRLPSLDKG